MIFCPIFNRTKINSPEINFIQFTRNIMKSERKIPMLNTKRLKNYGSFLILSSR